MKAESQVSDRIRFHALTMEDGLSISSVNTITEDRLGYLWFGTQDGLNRYDGSRFDHINHIPGDPSGLVSPTVNKILFDSKNTVWVFTPQGIDSIDIETLEISHWTERLLELSHNKGGHSKDENTASVHVKSISLSSDNKLLVLTDQFVALIDQENDSVKRLKQFDTLIQNLKAIQILYFQERLYLLEESCMVSVTMEGSNRQNYCVSADVVLEKLHVDHNNPQSFLVSGTEGFAIFEGSKEVLTYHPVIDERSSSKVRVLDALTHGNGYWLATSSGLKYWDSLIETVTIEYFSDFTDNYSIENNYIQTIWESSGGIFWIGNLSGINYWESEQQFTHLLQKREVMKFNGNNYTTSLLKLHGGDLLVGTDSSGIYKYNDDFSILTHYTPLPVGQKEIETGYVAGMIEDRHRNIWIISDSGLFFKTYTDDKYQFLPEVHDVNGQLLDLKDLSTITETRDGEIWVGGEFRLFQIKINQSDADQSNDYRVKNYSLEFIDHSQLIPEYLINSSYGVYTIYEDLQSYLWLGFAKGLIRLNPITFEVEIFESVPSDPQTLSNSDITVIYEDLLGVLWVGTVSGLNRVRFNSQGDVYFQRVTESDGFVDDFICSILADESGYLWISTANGLVKYHPDKGVPVNFTYNDGLQHSEFFTNADFADNKGNLFFGGINGITLLNPHEVSIDKAEDTLQFTSVKQAGELTELSREGETYYANVTDKGVVSIRLSTFDFINGANADYRYKIKKYEDRWVSLAEPIIRLHKLDQDQLFIKAQGRQKNGQWSDKEVGLSLSIDESFWASTQGFALYLLILVMTVFGVIFYLFRYYSRRLSLQVKKLKERKAQSQLLLSEKKTLLYQVEDLQYSLSEQRYLVERLESQIENQKMNDPLTGFKSKHYLKQHIANELENIANSWQENQEIAGIYLGVFAVDIDNLAVINKEHGHLCGNEVLKQAADCLRTISYGTDTLVRWQGATLLVLSRGIEKREQMIMAEKIRSIIASRKFDLANGASIDVTCSVGFSRFPFLGNPQEMVTWEQLMYVINRALTVAKNNSRNAWLGIYTNQFSHPQEVRAQITTNLSGLLTSGQLDYVSSIPKSNKIDWGSG